MKIAGKTETGLRKQNEDAFCIHAKDGRCYIAVSDGMGGHAAGEIASRIATETFQTVLSDSQLDAAALRNAVLAANTEVYQASLSNEAYQGMGATLVCAILFADTFLAANVGDSRIYCYHNGVMTQISHDHSFVAELVSRKIISQQEAKTHPRRNLITRAIGTESRVKVDLFGCEWEKDDILLLCSDGLSGSVTEEEMIRILEEKPDLDSACKALIALALQNGSTDNITVILAKNSEDDE